MVSMAPILRTKYDAATPEAPATTLAVPSSSPMRSEGKAQRSENQKATNVCMVNAPPKASIAKKADSRATMRSEPGRRSPVQFVPLAAASPGLASAAALRQA